MYNTLIYQPILHSLLFLYNMLGENLGMAIIVLTLAIRLILLPFVIPSIKSAKKMATLKPELDKLQKKYKNNPEKLKQKQLEFYKKHNLNPATGCLPYIVQLLVLIALYRVFMNSLKEGMISGHAVNLKFFIWDLSKKDTTYSLPILSGILQLLTSLAISPGIENEPNKRKGNKEEKEGVAEMAQTMQQQMVFMMPAMTVLFAIQFPSGLALYWTVTTAFSLVQQIAVAGLGGLEKYLRKLNIRRSK